MSLDAYAHLPVRQWLAVRKLVRDLEIAEDIASKATHIKDYNRWRSVTIDIKNDIAKASQEGWRP